jgi:hypothetical protein
MPQIPAAIRDHPMPMSTTSPGTTVNILKNSYYGRATARRKSCPEQQMFTDVEEQKVWEWTTQLIRAGFTPQNVPQLRTTSDFFFFLFFFFF